MTFGLGRVLGAIFGGFVESANTIKLPVEIAIPGMNGMDKLVNWQAIFTIPTGMTFACLLAFPFLFRLKKSDLEPKT